MTCYLISYDLRKKKDYESLYKAIKAYSGWAHILESTWAVTTNLSAKQVRDDLKKHIDSDDGLFVLKSGVEAAWVRVNCKDEWLKENL